MIRIIEWQHHESTFMTTTEIWLKVEEDGRVYTGMVYLEEEEE